jgi:hypothetical protein
MVDVLLIEEWIQNFKPVEINIRRGLKKKGEK